jgi:hypothetical protein
LGPGWIPGTEESALRTGSGSSPNRAPDEVREPSEPPSRPPLEPPKSWIRPNRLEPRKPRFSRKAAIVRLFGKVPIFTIMGAVISCCETFVALSGQNVNEGIRLFQGPRTGFQGSPGNRRNRPPRAPREPSEPSSGSTPGSVETVLPGRSLEPRNRHFPEIRGSPDSSLS